MISVDPDDTLLTAYHRMRLADVSQLPVLAGGSLVGISTNPTCCMRGARRGSDRFRDRVDAAMTDALETLAPGAGIAEVEAVLDGGLVAIVADESGFHGLITRVDLLNSSAEKRDVKREDTPRRPAASTLSPPARSTPASRPIRRPARS